MGHGFVYGGPVVRHWSSVALGGSALCSVDTSSGCPHSLDTCIQLGSHLLLWCHELPDQHLPPPPVEPGFECTTLYRDSSTSCVALIVHTESQVLAVLLPKHALQPAGKCAVRLAHALGTFEVTVTSQMGVSQQLRRRCDSDVSSAASFGIEHNC